MLTEPEYAFFALCDAGIHGLFGFRHAGLLREAGYKFQTWLDVAYLQLML
jgi:L-amino acid N-acyltransferase YncA